LKHGLVVDDSMTMRRILRNGLLESGVEHVAEASDGREALKLLQQMPMDLVVTGWQMPRMNGIELVAAIRHNPATAPVAVLMVASNATREEVCLALHAGIDDYLVKPFTMEVLRSKLSALKEFAPSLGRGRSAAADPR